jgi:hypothetical protein
MAGTVMINGINYSSKNVFVSMFGAAITGITKIQYDNKQTKENNYGFGTAPISRGYGKEEFTGSLEMYADEWKNIIANAPLNEPLKIPPFIINVIFTGDGVNFSQDNLLFCEFLEDPLAVNAGDTKIMLTIPFILGGIQHI